MNSNSLEIERRFLILRPPEPELAAMYKNEDAE